MANGFATGFAPARRALSLQDIRAGVTGGNASGAGINPGSAPKIAPQVATTAPAPQTPGDRYAGFEASPGYQFRQDEGRRAIENSAAARGRLFSGGTIKGLTRYSQGVASDEFQRYVGGLQSLAGVGQTAVNATSAYGAQTAANIGGAHERAGVGTGSAYAQGAAGTNNAIQAGIGNLAYIYGRR